MSDRIKLLKKALAKRPDVYADFERVGRPIKDASRVQAAIDDDGIPPAIAGFYADCDGLHVEWSFIGFDGDEGDARGLLGGQAKLLELDELRWHALGDHQVLRLETKWSARGLLVVRTPGRDDRMIYAGTELKDPAELAAVVELGSPEQFLPRWIELGMPHPAIWGTPALDQQRARLAKPPTKRKVDVGARVWPHKAKAHDTSDVLRGQVRATQAATNGKLYAEVAWDDGAVSWVRANLLAAFGRDRYELAAATPTTIDGLSPLLLWLTSNINSSCMVVTDAGTHQHTVALESWWLAKVLAATPLAACIDATTAWIEAREVPTPADCQRERDEGTHVPGPSEAVEPSMVCFGSRHLASSFAVRRAARALTDALVIRWLRESEDVAPPALIALDARVGSPYRNEDSVGSLADHLARPGKRTLAPRLDVDDERSRGEALGLPGPIRYTHD